MNIGFILCISGILLNALGITFDYLLLNAIGCVLTAVGSFKLGAEGHFARKIKFFSILSVPFALAAYGLTILYRTSTIDISILYVALGIVLFFYIYYTFYFTETLIDCARGINELAATRSFRGIWTLNGIVAFLFFFCYSSLKSTYLNIARAAFLLCALYYCFNIYSNSKILQVKKKND